MIRRFIAWAFGRCAAYGHQWVSIPGTPEEIARAEEDYREWFDNYPVGPYYEPAGHTECRVCGKWKPMGGSAGRPSGYHPGWG